MKILVITTSYPKEGSVDAYFVHTRNKFYKSHGHEVKVLNFASENSYVYEGINVIALEDYKKENYDLLVSHAPNLRNHMRFLNKYDDDFKKIVFFFHGHEVLKQSEIYPKPYEFKKKNPIRNLLEGILTDLYDSFKIKVLKKYILKNINKINLIFVSQWMLDMFLKFSMINFDSIREKSHIIYNSIGDHFEVENFRKCDVKEYDLISIRGNIDGSKYCVDLINKLAFNNPELKFILFGKGKYFDFNKKAPNLTHYNRTLNHREIIEEVNKARVVLLPTRTDAQGVMACEVNALGAPLITSDIPVMREVFDNTENVLLISNEAMKEKRDLSKSLIDLEKSYADKKNKKYYRENTVEKEMKLLEAIAKEKY